MGKDIKKDVEIKAKKAIADAEKKFATARKTMDNHIKNEPEKAVLIAAAVGAAIGAITMMALHKRKE